MLRFTPLLMIFTLSNCATTSSDSRVKTHAIKHDHNVQRSACRLIHNKHCPFSSKSYGEIAVLQDEGRAVDFIFQYSARELEDYFNALRDEHRTLAEIQRRIAQYAPFAAKSYPAAYWSELKGDSERYANAYEQASSVISQVKDGTLDLKDRLTVLSIVSQSNMMTLPFE